MIPQQIFDFQPSIPPFPPYLGTIFGGGGWGGVGGGGGGQKSVLGWIRTLVYKRAEG